MAKCAKCGKEIIGPAVVAQTKFYGTNTVVNERTYCPGCGERVETANCVLVPLVLIFIAAIIYLFIRYAQGWRLSWVAYILILAVGVFALVAIYKAITRPR